MVPTYKEAKRWPVIWLPQGKKIRYFQDLSTHETHLPRDWFLKRIDTHGDAELVRSGYGLRSDYGNGSIHVNLKQFETPTEPSKEKP